MGLSKDMGFVEVSRWFVHQQKNRAKNHATKQLASEANHQNAKATCGQEQKRDQTTESKMGNRCNELLEQRRLGGHHGSYWLLHATDCGNPCQRAWKSTGSRSSTGDGFTGSVWSGVSNQRGLKTNPQKRQWQGIHIKAVRGSVQAIRPGARIHHAIHAATKRHDRTVFQVTQGGVHLVAHVRKCNPCQTSRWKVDRILQHETSTPITELPKSLRISRFVFYNTCGLISGGHYNAALRVVVQIFNDSLPFVIENKTCNRSRARSIDV